MAHPAVDQVTRFLREEFVLNKNKRKANMVLLRSLGVFFGSVYVFRSFGEALFAV
ncbi:translocase of mitochondrial membrane [Dunaliella salina]|uniref:Translocase of mitochondrial membrane n=1 Tax=Dunaliella salina TaxID=3046 RepID=A0ABQ7GM08_DUNSA|nr:translocase of mitochondrial membrane [Dunaliella salina]|eukprot:KAF5835646.1 translocase of mitochondrial membrane [Dunaliella salina]